MDESVRWCFRCGCKTWHVDGRCEWESNHMEDPLKKTPDCELDRDSRPKIEPEWLTRPVPGDPNSVWVNLGARPELEVPMCLGQTFSGVTSCSTITGLSCSQIAICITESRMYSIGELKRMVEDALVDRQIS